MAYWRIPFRFGRRLFIKRRFTVGVVVASVPFLVYFLLIATSESGRFVSVPGKTLSTNIGYDCPCGTRQQTQNSEAVATSMTREQKVEHDSLNYTGTLNFHMWSEICGTNVDILKPGSH